MPDAGAAFVANARMYALTPVVANAWRELFAFVGREADISLRYLAHPAPAPLEELWARRDLGLVFACGLPLARGSYSFRPIAAPVPSPERYGGRSFYCTDLVVRADSGIRTLEEAFEGRIGWTVEHSQSGFNAVRHHLLQYRAETGGNLFKGSVGPLVTPRAVVDALLSGAIETGPLDSYVLDLLRKHEPATAAALQVVGSTVMTPIPLLVASPELSADAMARLRAALLAAGSRPELAEVMSTLLLKGFARPDETAYAELDRQAKQADEAGYPTPA